MPLLTVEPKGKKNVLRFEIDSNTNTDLNLYSRYANNASTDSIIREALLYVFKQDSGFQEWKKDPDNLKATEPSRRAKKGASATGNGAPPSIDATAKK